MAFFPTYREIVCVVFPPRVKGLMLESWRQSDQNIPRILIPHLASPQSLSMIKKTTGATIWGHLIMMKSVLTFSPRSVGSYRCSDS